MDETEDLTQSREPARQGSVLRVGETCWRRDLATSISFLVDNAYFEAAHAAMASARKSIFLLGWHFHPHTPLGIGAAPQQTIGTFLSALKDENPALDIRLLIWDVVFPATLITPLRRKRLLRKLDPRITYRTDTSAPYGASHHQKILVVDDEIAFCGGVDFLPNRLDKPQHPHDAPWRRWPDGTFRPPWHDMMMRVTGPAAAALGELARQRWLNGTGEIPPPPMTLPSGRRPDSQAALTDIPVAIARTVPGQRGQPAIRECEALVLAAIKSAKTLIYIEGQYFASPLIAAALAARLAEPEGPAILMILSSHSPSVFDRLTMDSERGFLVTALRRADRYKRLAIYAPKTKKGGAIIVHSKTLIIDDCFMRSGSSNLNNRSFGFDTECDLAFEVGSDPLAAQAIRRLRTWLVALFLGCATETLSAAIEAQGGLIPAIEQIDRTKRRRLKPVSGKLQSLFALLFGELHLGDPMDPDDSWRPWRRRAKLRALLARHLLSQP